MATLQNERDKTLQASNPRLVATTVAISSSAGALFVKPNAIDPISPTGLTLTGDTTVFTTPVVIAWYYASNEDMVWNDYDITGSNIGPNRALTSADFITHLGTSGTKVFYKAIATQTGFATAESPLFEIEYSDLSGSAGADGVDAYHIRLDNESRYVLYDYTGAPVSGSMPVEAQLYVTKGAVDITTGTGYVTYSVQSTSGATGASVNSTTGEVTVTGVTLDTNYVELKALIEEPSLPVISVYKKLFIYKVTQATLEVDVDVTQDHAYYQYADSTSTTNTAAWSSITFTAVVQGYPNAVVTWSAKVYNTAGTEITGTETIFTATNNTCTVSAAQFISRGGNLAARMDVTASYTVGNTEVFDFGVIYRNDGANGSRFLYASNVMMTFSSDTLGDVSAAQLASEFSDLQVINLAADTLADDSIGWTYTASFGPSLTGTINGANPHTASALPIRLLLTSITADLGEVIDENIVVTASKSGFPSVSRTIRVRVTPPATDGYELVVDPDKLILLPVDSAGNIVGYDTAIRDVWLRKGTTDDSANWSFSIVNGPGVTANIAAGTLSVTNFVSANPTIDFASRGSGTFTGLYHIANSSSCHNEAGTLLVAIAPNNTTDNPHRVSYSGDYGVTWTQATLPVPPVSYTSFSATGVKYLAYYKPGNKFVYFYQTPFTGGNGRLIHSANGSTWTSETLPNTTGADAWGGLATDRATSGKVYLHTSNGRYLYHATTLSSWTSVDAGDTISSTRLGVYNGVAIRHAYAAYVGKYSSSLTSWTAYTANSGNTDYSARGLYQISTFFVAPYSNSGGTGVGLVYSTDSTGSTWRYISTGNHTGTYLLGKGVGNDIYFSVGSGTSAAIYVTEDNFSTVRRCTITGPNPPVTNSGSATTSVVSFGDVPSIIGQPLVVESGKAVIPAYSVTSGTPNNTLTCYMGTITPGNNSTESYITVTATPNDPELSPIIATVIVRKAAYVSDNYTLVVNPGTIQLPATADGVVYPSSFTNNTNTSTYSVLKNGVPYTGNITGSIVASSGITASVSGSSSTGTVTVSAMTTGTTDGTVTGTVSIDGVPGQTLNISIKVVKLKDGMTSGLRPGTTASGFTSTDTSIAIRFNPSGTFEIKRGAGSYVYAGDWYQPVNASSPPGSNYYMTMFYTSDTFDTLAPTGSATVNSATYVVLSAAQEWTLSNAVTGRHTIFLEPRIGTSTAGANAVMGSGKLELQVP